MASSFRFAAGKQKAIYGDGIREDLPPLRSTNHPGVAPSTGGDSSSRSKPGTVSSFG